MPFAASRKFVNYYGGSDQNKQMIDSANILEKADLLEQINRLNWFHSIDFGNGVVSPGKGKSLALLKQEADAIFPASLAGKDGLGYRLLGRLL